MNKTSVPSIDSIDRQWYLVDAENQTLGRLATEVASVLRGKNKASYTLIWTPAILSLSSMPKK